MNFLLGLLSDSFVDIIEVCFIAAISSIIPVTLIPIVRHLRLAMNNDKAEDANEARERYRDAVSIIKSDWKIIILLVPALPVGITVFYEMVLMENVSYLFAVHIGVSADIIFGSIAKGRSADKDSI